MAVWTKITVPFRIQPLRGIVFITRSRWQCSHHLQDHATFARTPHICQIKNLLDRICGGIEYERIQWINSSWWFFSTHLKKYARQIGSFPLIEMNIQKIETTLPRIDLDCFFLGRKLRKERCKTWRCPKAAFVAPVKNPRPLRWKEEIPGCRSGAQRWWFLGFVLAMNVKSTWKKKTEWLWMIWEIPKNQIPNNLFSGRPNLINHTKIRLPLK